MGKRVLPLLIEYCVIAVSFFLLGLYGYFRFFQTPYLGFYFNPSNGQILQLFDQPSSSPSLQVGDQLLQVGNIPWQAYVRNLRQPLFVDASSGTMVPVRIWRDHRELTIIWILPGPSLAEVFNRLMLFWLPYAFWLAGTATLLLIYPRDNRWRLLVGFNYLTAFWIMTGLVSIGRVGDSAVLMRMAIWLCLPVYWHLHWVFPQPLNHLPAASLWGLYLVGIALALAQWFQWIVPSAYLIGYLLALAGSIILLIIHAARQPGQRQDVRLLGISVGIVILPAVMITTIGLVTSFPWFSAISVLALPIIPGVYFFTIYRHQLGGLELRANRAIALALYTLLLFLVIVTTLAVVSLIVIQAGQWIAIGVGVAIVTGLVSILFYPRFERFVQFRLLGMPLPPTRLLETYSARITTSLERDRLIALLKNEVLPTLLVRQAVLLKLTDAGLEPFFTLNVSGDALLTPENLACLRAQIEGKRLDLLSQCPFCAWVRLGLPLQMDGRWVGLLLLGRRDPDNLYPASEMPILQALMDQTAVAMQNVSQAERLRAFYRADIERQEAERFHLARELHDGVLGQLALLAQNIDVSAESHSLVTAYQTGVEQIREIVHGLRPTMLAYGLRAALYELGDDLISQNRHSGRQEPSIEVQLAPGDERYPPEAELHLFRIVQQACQNTIQHAQSHHLHIQGVLAADHIDLTVCDDGVGFALGDHPDLSRLLAQKHYGLAGMYERATLVNARLEIVSAPGEGTTVRIRWGVNF